MKVLLKYLRWMVAYAKEKNAAPSETVFLFVRQEKCVEIWVIMLMAKCTQGGKLN